MAGTTTPQARGGTTPPAVNPTLRAAVDAIAHGIGRRRLNSTALAAVLEVQVETTVVTQSESEFFIIIT